MNRRILLVDDSLTVLKLAERQLVAAGYEVVCASTAAKALELARAQPPSAVVLDYLLPDMNGPEVCREFSRIEELSNVPIIVLSGRKASRLEQEFAAFRSVKACVEKPFRGDSLRCAVLRVVGRDGSEASAERNSFGGRASTSAGKLSSTASEASRRRKVLEGNDGGDPGGSHERKDRVTRIVDEIMAVFEKSPSSRRVLLRMLVRKYFHPNFDAETNS